MRFVLFVLALLAIFAAFAILAISKSAVQEIEGFLVLTIAAVLLSGAAIVDAIVHASGQRKGTGI